MCRSACPYPIRCGQWRRDCNIASIAGYIARPSQGLDLCRVVRKALTYALEAGWRRPANWRAMYVADPRQPCRPA